MGGQGRVEGVEVGVTLGRRDRDSADETLDAEQCLGGVGLAGLVQQQCLEGEHAAVGWAVGQKVIGDRQGGGDVAGLEQRIAQVDVAAGIAGRGGAGCAIGGDRLVEASEAL